MDFLSVKEFFTKVLNWISKPDGPSMTETELNTFLNSLNRNFRGSVNWIVEEGTDGIWTYRKWDSGIAECWGTASGTTTCNSTWGSTMYITPALSVTFPEDLFLEPPKVTYSSASHANSSLIPFNSGTTTKSVFMFQMGRMTSIASQNYFLDIVAKGRWK